LRNYWPGAVNLPNNELTFQSIASAPENARTPGSELNSYQNSFDQLAAFHLLDTSA
jgi:hypothetical protein